MVGKLWHCLEIERLPCGELLAQIAELITEDRPGTWIMCRGLVGLGAFYSQVDTSDGKVLTTAELLSLCRMIQRLEWGTFFFCESKALAEQITLELAYPAAIAISYVTIRAFDEQSYMVYTADAGIIDSMRRAFPDLLAEAHELSDFVYPD